MMAYLWLTRCGHLGYRIQEKERHTTYANNSRHNWHTINLKCVCVCVCVCLVLARVRRINKKTNYNSIRFGLDRGAERLSAIDSTVNPPFFLSLHFQSFANNKLTHSTGKLNISYSSTLLVYFGNIYITTLNDLLLRITRYIYW